jgi:hypothetical protein
LKRIVICVRTCFTSVLQQMGTTIVLLQIKSIQMKLLSLSALAIARNMKTDFSPNY